MAEQSSLGRFAAVALLCLCAGFSGCAKQFLARRIVEAPNIQYPIRPGAANTFADLARKTYSQTWSVQVGPGPALISIGVVEPGEYHLKYKSDVSRKPDPSGGETETFVVNGSWTAREKGPPMTPKGTIILLHGIMESKEQMVPWAVFLAQKGYRTVVVDLRGHGQSSGERWVTFGVREANDLKIVTDDLIRRGLVADRVGLLGRSYGASVGLIWASQDPRVAAIVALEPYSDPRRAIDDFSKAFFPKERALVSDATFAAAIERASQLAGFQWGDADVVSAVKKIRIPILFFHGTLDTWVPPHNSEELVAVAPKGSVLIHMQNETHLSLAFRLGNVAEKATSWFDQHLAERPAGPATDLGH